MRTAAAAYHLTSFTPAIVTLFRASTNVPLPVSAGERRRLRCRYGAGAAAAVLWLLAVSSGLIGVVTAANYVWSPCSGVGPWYWETTCDWGGSNPPTAVNGDGAVFNSDYSSYSLRVQQMFQPPNQLLWNAPNVLEFMPGGGFLSPYPTCTMNAAQPFILGSGGTFTCNTISGGGTLTFRTTADTSSTFDATQITAYSTSYHPYFQFDGPAVGTGAWLWLLYDGVSFNDNIQVLFTNGANVTMSAQTSFSMANQVISIDATSHLYLMGGTITGSVSTFTLSGTLSIGPSRGGSAGSIGGSRSLASGHLDMMSTSLISGSYTLNGGRMTLSGALDPSTFNLNYYGGVLAVPTTSPQFGLFFRFYNSWTFNPPNIILATPTIYVSGVATSLNMMQGTIPSATVVNLQNNAQLDSGPGCTMAGSVYMNSGTAFTSRCTMPSSAYIEPATGAILNLYGAMSGGISASPVSSSTTINVFSSATISMSSWTTFGSTVNWNGGTLAGGAILISDSTVFTVTNGTFTSGTISLSVGTFVPSPGITFGSFFTYNHNSGFTTTTFPAGTNFAGTLTVSGGPTVIQGPSTTFSGPITISSGSLTVNQGATLSGSVTATGGGLYFDQVTASLGSTITIGASISFTQTANTIISGTIIFNAGSYSFSTGTFHDMTVGSSATVTIYNGVTITGLIRVQGGQFTMQSSFALNGGAAWRHDSGVSNIFGSFTSNSYAYITSTASSITFQPPIFAGSLTLTAPAMTLSSSISIQPAARFAGSGTLTFQGTVPSGVSFTITAIVLASTSALYGPANLLSTSVSISADTTVYPSGGTIAVLSLTTGTSVTTSIGNSGVLATNGGAAGASSAFVTAPGSQVIWNGGTVRGAFNGAGNYTCQAPCAVFGGSTLTFDSSGYLFGSFNIPSGSTLSMSNGYLAASPLSSGTLSLTGLTKAVSVVSPNIAFSGRCFFTSAVFVGPSSIACSPALIAFHTALSVTVTSGPVTFNILNLVSSGTLSVLDGASATVQSGIGNSATELKVAPTALVSVSGWGVMPSTLTCVSPGGGQFLLFGRLASAASWSGTGCYIGGANITGSVTPPANWNFIAPPISILAGGTLALQNFGASVTGGIAFIAGSLLMTATSSISVSGGSTITVNGGTLTLNAGTLSSALYFGGAGATMTISGAGMSFIPSQFTMVGGSVTVQSSGTMAPASMLMTGGSLTVQTSSFLSGVSMTISGGTVTCAATGTIGGGIALSGGATINVLATYQAVTTMTGGTINFQSASVIASAASFGGTAGIINMLIGVSITVVGSGPAFTLGGSGTINGPSSGNQLTATGAGNLVFSRLSFAGTLSCSVTSVTLQQTTMATTASIVSYGSVSIGGGTVAGTITCTNPTCSLVSVTATATTPFTVTASSSTPAFYGAMSGITGNLILNDMAVTGTTAVSTSGTITLNGQSRINAGAVLTAPLGIGIATGTLFIQNGDAVLPKVTLSANVQVNVAAGASLTVNSVMSMLASNVIYTAGSLTLFGTSANGVRGIIVVTAAVPLNITGGLAGTLYIDCSTASTVLTGSMYGSAPSILTVNGPVTLPASFGFGGASTTLRLNGATQWFGGATHLMSAVVVAPNVPLTVLSQPLTLPYLNFSGPISAQAPLNLTNAVMGSGAAITITCQDCDLNLGTASTSIRGVITAPSGRVAITIDKGITGPLSIIGYAGGATKVGGSMAASTSILTVSDAEFLTSFRFSGATAQLLMSGAIVMNGPQPAPNINPTGGPITVTSGSFATASGAVTLPTLSFGALTVTVGGGLSIGVVTMSSPLSVLACSGNLASAGTFQGTVTSSNATATITLSGTLTGALSVVGTAAGANAGTGLGGDLSGPQTLTTQNILFVSNFGFNGTILNMNGPTTVMGPSARINPGIMNLVGSSILTVLSTNDKASVVTLSNLVWGATTVRATRTLLVINNATMTNALSALLTDWSTTIRRGQLRGDITCTNATATVTIGVPARTNSIVADLQITGVSGTILTGDLNTTSSVLLKVNLMRFASGFSFGGPAASMSIASSAIDGGAILAPGISLTSTLGLVIQNGLVVIPQITFAATSYLTVASASSVLVLVSGGAPTSVQLAGAGSVVTIAGGTIHGTVSVLVPLPGSVTLGSGVTIGAGNLIFASTPYPAIATFILTSHATILAVEAGWTVASGSAASGSGTLTFTGGSIAAPSPMLLATTTINGPMAGGVLNITGSGSVQLPRMLLNRGGGGTIYSARTVSLTFTSLSIDSASTVRPGGDLTLGASALEGAIIASGPGLITINSGISVGTPFSVFGVPGGGSRLTGSMLLNYYGLIAGDIEFLPSLAYDGSTLTLSGSVKLNGPTLSSPDVVILGAGTLNITEAIPMNFPSMQWGAGATVHTYSDLTLGSATMSGTAALISRRSADVTINGGTVSGSFLATAGTPGVPCVLSVVVSASDIGFTVSGSATAIVRYQGTTIIPSASPLTLQKFVLVESGNFQGSGPLNLDGCYFASAATIGTSGPIGGPSAGVVTTIEAPRAFSTSFSWSGLTNITGSGSFSVPVGLAFGNAALVPAAATTVTGSIAMQSASVTYNSVIVGAGGLTLTAAAPSTVHASSVFYVAAGVTLAVGPSVDFSTAQTIGLGTTTFTDPVFTIATSGRISTAVVVIIGSATFTHAGQSAFIGEFRYSVSIQMSGPSGALNLTTAAPQSDSCVIRANAANVVVTLNGVLRGNLMTNGVSASYQLSGTVPGSALLQVSSSGGATTNTILAGSALTILTGGTLRLVDNTIVQSGVSFSGSTGTLQMSGVVTVTAPFTFPASLTVYGPAGSGILTLASTGTVIFPKLDWSAGIVSVSAATTLNITACTMTGTALLRSTGGAVNIATSVGPLTGDFNATGGTPAFTFGAVTTGDVTFTGGVLRVFSIPGTVITPNGPTTFSTGVQLVAASFGAGLTLILDGCTVLPATTFPTSGLTINGPTTQTTTIQTGNPGRTFPPIAIWSATLALTGTGFVQFIAPAAATQVGGGTITCLGTATMHGTFRLEPTQTFTFGAGSVVTQAQVLALEAVSTATTVTGTVQIQANGNLTIGSSVILGPAFTASGPGVLTFLASCTVLGPGSYASNLQIVAPSGTVTFGGNARVVLPNILWGGALAVGAVPSGLNITNAYPMITASIASDGSTVYVSGGNAMRGTLDGRSSGAMFFIATRLISPMTVTGGATLAGAMTGDTLIIIISSSAAPVGFAAGMTYGNNTLVPDASGFLTVAAPATYGVYTAWTGGDLAIIGSGNVHFGQIFVGSGRINMMPGTTMSGTFTVSGVFNLTTLRIAPGATFTINGGGTVIGRIYQNNGTLLLTGGVTVGAAFDTRNGGKIVLSGCTVQTLAVPPAPEAIFGGPLAGDITTVFTNTFPSFVGWTGVLRIATNQVVTFPNLVSPGLGASVTSQANTSHFVAWPAGLFLTQPFEFTAAYTRDVLVSGSAVITGAVYITATTQFTVNPGISVGTMMTIATVATGTLNLLDGVTLIGPNNVLTAANINGPSLGRNLTVTGAITLSTLLWNGAVRLGSTTASLTIAVAKPSATASIVTSTAATQTVTIGSSATLRGTLFGPGSYAVSGVLSAPADPLTILGGAVLTSGAITGASGKLQLSSGELRNSVTIASNVLLFGPVAGSTLTVQTPRKFLQIVSQWTGTVALSGSGLLEFGVGGSVLFAGAVLTGPGPSQFVNGTLACTAYCTIAGALTVGVGSFRVQPATGTLAGLYGTIATATGATLIIDTGMTVNSAMTILATGTGTVQFNANSRLNGTANIAAAVSAPFGLLTISGGTITLSQLTWSNVITVDANLVVTTALPTAAATLAVADPSQLIWIKGGSIRGTFTGPGTFQVDSGTDMIGGLTLAGGCVARGRFASSTNAPLSIAAGAPIRFTSSTVAPTTLFTSPLRIIVSANANAVFATPQSVLFTAWAGNVRLTGTGSFEVYANTTGAGASLESAAARVTGAIAVSGVLTLNATTIDAGGLSITSPFAASQLLGVGTSPINIPATTQLTIGVGMTIDPTVSIAGAGTLILANGVTVIGPQIAIQPATITGPPASGQIFVAGSGIIRLPRMAWAGTLNVATGASLYLNLTSTYGPTATAWIVGQSFAVINIDGKPNALQGVLSGTDADFTIVGAGLVNGGILRVDGYARLSGTVDGTSATLRLDYAQVQSNTYFNPALTIYGPLFGVTVVLNVPLSFGGSIQNVGGTLFAAGSGPLSIGALYLNPGATCSMASGATVSIAGGVLQGIFSVFNRLQVKAVAFTASAELRGAGVVSVDRSVVPSNVTIDTTIQFEVLTNSTLGVAGGPYRAPYQYAALTLKAGAFVTFDMSGSIRVNTLLLDAPAGFIAPANGRVIATFPTAATFNMHSPVVLTRFEIISREVLTINTVSGSQSILMYGGSTITTFKGIVIDLGSHPPPSELLVSNVEDAHDKLNLLNRKAFTFQGLNGNTTLNLNTCVNATGILPLVPEAAVSVPPNCDYTDLYDACLSSPCMEVGSVFCTNLQDAYACTCKPGYSGYRCETEINECASQPCRNGATCTDLINGFNCTCLVTFVGVTCEIDVNECATANGGCDITFSHCMNYFGGFNCSSYVVPDTLTSMDPVDSYAPLVLGRASAYQRLDMNVSALTQNIERELVFYFGPVYDLLRFRAITCSVVDGSVLASQLVRCILPDIGGVGLHVTLMHGTTLMFTTADTFAVPRPVITPMTVLRNQTGYGLPTAQLYIDANYPVPIQFGVDFILPTRPELMSVFYGPVSNPLRFECQILPAQLTDRVMTCMTAPDSKGLTNFVTMTVCGQVVLGTDIIDLPVYPIIQNISGCAVSNIPVVGSPDVFGTRGCSTEGGERIVINGTDFATTFGATVVTVGGLTCTHIIVYDEVSLSCLVPAGTGQRKSVVVTSVSRPSPIVAGLSYAYPTLLGVTGCVPQPGNLSTIDCPRFGANRITVSGINFGASGAVALIGSSVCTNIVQNPSNPHRLLSCTLPAAVTRYSIIGIPIIVIQSGGLSSGSVSISYLQCPTGSYAVGLFCIPCPTGQASGVKEAQSCNDCLPGTYSGPAPSSLCVQCPIATSSGVGKSACNNCTVGRASPSIGVAECPLCGQGEYSSRNGSSVCTPCASGTFQSKLGATRCIDCLAGTATAATRSLICNPCDRGYYAANNATSQCEPCPLGTYQTDTGRSFCLACPPGSSSDGVGKSTCSSCTRGQYGVNSLCFDCPGGYVQPNEGATKCMICPAGYFAHIRSSECSSCQTNFMAPRPGTADCTGCPLRSVSNSLLTRCECEVGAYATTDDEHMQCEDCPPGATCETDGVTVSAMVADSGYWRAGNNSVQFYLCLQKDQCLSGDRCALNRVGPLCAVCRPGFRSDTSGQECSICPSHNAAIGGSIGFTILIIAALLVIFYAMWHSEGKLVPKHDPFKKVKAFSVEDRVAPDYTYNFKLILGYLQVATSILSLVDIPWPTYFTTFIHYFDFVNLDFVPWGSVECVASLTFYDKLLLYALLPPAVLGLLAAIPYTILIVQDRMDYSDHAATRVQRKLRRRKVLKLVVFALFLMYPTISSRVLSFFVCREVDGTQYLAADFHLECHTPEYERNVGLAVICILVYPIGIPAAVFLILYRNRNRLKIPDTQLAYGLLYEAYQRQFWYFEMIDIIAKLWLTSLLQFFDPSAQCSVGLVITTLYLWTILLFGPYIRRIDDRLAQFIQAQLYCILLMGLTLQHVEFVRKSKEDALGSAVLLIILFALIILLVYHGGIFARNWYRNWQRTRALADEVTMHDNPLTAAEAEGKPKDLSLDENTGAEEDDDTSEEVSAPRARTESVSGHTRNMMSVRSKPPPPPPMEGLFEGGETVAPPPPAPIAEVELQPTGSGGHVPVMSSQIRLSRVLAEILPRGSASSRTGEEEPEPTTGAASNAVPPVPAPPFGAAAGAAEQQPPPPLPDDEDAPPPPAAAAGDDDDDDDDVAPPPPPVAPAKPVVVPKIAPPPATATAAVSPTPAAGSKKIAIPAAFAASKPAATPAPAAATAAKKLPPPPVPRASSVTTLPPAPTASRSSLEVAPSTAAAAAAKAPPPVIRMPTVMKMSLPPIPAMRKPSSTDSAGSSTAPAAVPVLAKIPVLTKVTRPAPPPPTPAAAASAKPKPLAATSAASPVKPAIPASQPPADDDDEVAPPPPSAADGDGDDGDGDDGAAPPPPADSNL